MKCLSRAVPSSFSSLCFVLCHHLIPQHSESLPEDHIHHSYSLHSHFNILCLGDNFSLIEEIHLSLKCSCLVSLSRSIEKICSSTRLVKQRYMSPGSPTFKKKSVYVSLINIHIHLSDWLIFYSFFPSSD